MRIYRTPEILLLSLALSFVGELARGVEKMAGALLQAEPPVLRRGMIRQHQEACVRQLWVHGTQDIETAAADKVKIEDHDVWRGGKNAVDRILPDVEDAEEHCSRGRQPGPSQPTRRRPLWHRDDVPLAL